MSERRFERITPTNQVSTIIVDQQLGRVEIKDVVQHYVPLEFTGFKTFREYIQFLLDQNYKEVTR